MEQSLKKTSSNYGLYLGLLLVIITVLIYVIKVELFTAWWLGILLIILIIAFGIAAALKSKKILGGFISFKEAFTSYFITIAIGTFLSTLAGIVIFNIVDPEAAQYVNEKIIDMTAETMENWGAPQDSIEQAIAKMEETDNFSIMAQLQSYVIRLVILCVLGLIVAVAVKKTDPEVA